MTATATKITRPATKETLVGSATVAAALGTSPQQVRRWMDGEGLPGYRFGSLLRFRLSDVREWAHQRDEATA